MKLSQQEWLLLVRTYLSLFIQRSFLELNPETRFRDNWHLYVIADALERCRRGEIRRLIINVPPRSLKSHSVSVAFVAWLLGHNPSTQIICASYAQELADKLSGDCRALMLTDFYRKLFPTRLSPQKRALSEFATTANGFRMATSVGGVLTGRGADLIIIDDPLKPDEAISEVQRQNVNAWYDHSLCTRLNNKNTGCIILVMQRLHEDDLVGHVTGLGDWTVLRFPAIAEEDEFYEYETPFGPRKHHRRAGEALHPERESLENLADLRATSGEYNFAGQYQQSPAPLGGGLVKGEWFKRYTSATRPDAFEMIFQSWDTANKATELSDYSVCTTWGKKGKDLFLLHVLRERLEYPELKRTVQLQAKEFGAKNILIEDKASGTQLIQDLKADGFHAVTRYEPKLEKVMRMQTVTPTIENGFVYLPDDAHWLAEYMHELITFPNGKFDDQADSTSQALDWVKEHGRVPAIVEFWTRMAERDKVKVNQPGVLNDRIGVRIPLLASLYSRSD